MHQEHNIPWNQLAKNFRFIRHNPHFTPQVTGVWPRDLPSQARDLDHFRRVLGKAISTFADTERRKYDGATLVLSPNALLFSNEIKERYRQRYGYNLDDKVQQLKYWEWAADLYRDSLVAPPRKFYEPHMNLSDAVTIFISENQLHPILILAHNPDTPILSLKHQPQISQYYEHGFAGVIEPALYSYVFINLFAAMGILDDGRYLETKAYSQLLETVGLNRAGRYMHTRYLDKMEKDIGTKAPLLHKDYPLLKEYLKACFAILYRYEVVLRELGDDPCWEDGILWLFVFPKIGHRGVRIDSKVVEGKDKYYFA